MVDNKILGDIRVNWKPIKTAPKDGSKILAMAKGWHCPEVIYWGNGNEIPDSGWVYARENINHWSFHMQVVTHYIEIPSYSDLYQGENK